MANYRLNEKAKADLRRIYLRGFEAFGEAQADRYFYAFFQRFEQIAENPNVYPTVDHIKNGYRRSVCGVDSIYYRMNDGVVEIMRTLGRQDVDSEFG